MRLPAARRAVGLFVVGTVVVIVAAFANGGCGSSQKGPTAGSASAKAAPGAGPGAGNLVDPTPEEAQFRAMFVATAYNTDWPSRPGLHRRVQKDEIRTIIDRAKELNCNVIILQVRSFCDRIYRKTQLADPYSPEPWAMPLNNSHDPDDPNKPVKDYDPMAEWINACDNAGLELHAWINPFRTNRLISIKQNGEDRYLPVVKYAEQLYLNPTSKAVQDYVNAVLDDFLENYPSVSTSMAPPSLMMPTASMMLQQQDEGGMDGVIYDHQIPPDTGPGGGGRGGRAAAPGAEPTAAPGATSKSWAEARTDWLIKKWKELNKPVLNDSDVTLKSFIESSAAKFKAKPYELKFGFSPQGQVKEHRDWVESGHFNYIIPELYVPNETVADLKYWLDAAAVPTTKPAVIAGLYGARTQTPAQGDETAWDPSEIINQMQDVETTTSSNLKAVGHAHYSGSALRYPDQGGPAPDNKNMGRKLKEKYEKPRLVPKSHDSTDAKPDAPKDVGKVQQGGKWYAKWSAGDQGRKPRKWAVWLHHQNSAADEWDDMIIVPRKTKRWEVSADVDAIRVVAIDRFNRRSDFGSWPP